MIWNSVAAHKESQQKWCYSLFIFSSLVVCTFTNKQKIVVCYFSVMITIKAMVSMALFTVITTTCKNYKLSRLKMTSL